MITLQAKNSDLLINSKYSYLVGNNLSGVTTLSVINSDGFADDDYLLLGEFGSESSEIVQINTGGVNTSTHVLTLTAATKFSHSESTKVSIIKYNQVRFYHTATATFSTSSQVGSDINIQADSIYTKIYDSTNTTGFGWVVFYNSTTLKLTQNSNAIPYSGFGENSVEKILSNFFSLLNNKESTLISTEDALSWLNEGYSNTREELNLVNSNYTVATEYDVTTTSGLQEYSLPSDFSEMLAVYDSSDTKVNLGNIDHTEISEWDASAGNATRYYLRGDYLGFSPVPSSAETYKIKYKTKITVLNSLYDDIELPNNNHYCLKDFMMYRAAIKLKRNDANNFYKMWRNGVDQMKVTTHNRAGSLDAWGISDNANI